MQQVHHTSREKGKKTEEPMSTKQTQSGAVDVSAIDKAIASAKNRKATREGAPAGATAAAPKAAKAAKAPSAPKRPRLTDEQKNAREATKAADRAEKKAARDLVRAAKKAEKNASKSPAHMKKVAKAAERLGTLSERAQLLLNEATANLTAAELSTLALHIAHFNRVKSTERALDQSIEAGMSVSIVGGDPRFVGQTGTVTKSQRIRCYVSVAGAKKPIYCFTSDVVPVAATARVAAAS
jgi:hypothetical protein